MIWLIFNKIIFVVLLIILKGVKVGVGREILRLYICLGENKGVWIRLWL